MANKPNTRFNLNVKDIELIESALFLAQANADEAGKREIQNVRAKLHHQKFGIDQKKIMLVVDKH
jgi:hypothetical protein